MIAGGLVATAMTVFVELAKPRRSRIELPFDASALREIRTFVGAFAARNGWEPAMAERLDAASEETMLTLLHQDGTDDDAPRRLRLVAYREDRAAVLEFVASKGEANIQDRLALLGEIGAADSIERVVSLRLLRHHASSVHHQQYHDTDIVTVRVDPPRADTGGPS